MSIALLLKYNIYIFEIMVSPNPGYVISDDTI